MEFHWSYCYAQVPLLQNVNWPIHKEKNHHDRWRNFSYEIRSFVYMNALFSVEFFHYLLLYIDIYIFNDLFELNLQAAVFLPVESFDTTNFFFSHKVKYYSVIMLYICWMQ